VYDGDLAMHFADFAMGAAIVALSRAAFADAAKEPPPYDESALKSALDEPPGASKRTEKAGAALEVPPPPPRKTGVVVEGSVGAMGFFGKLNTVSPAASTFHAQLGFEPFRWLMVFGEGDLSFTSTRYSPPARGYSIYAFGGGGRLTLAATERVSIYGQVDFGLSAVSSNVLHSYGFYAAEHLNGYVGGTAGLEWYQADPHYALAVYGGVRNAQGFQRAISSDVGLAWRGAVAIRYAF
jgi:hypothetical protein